MDYSTISISPSLNDDTNSIQSPNPVSLHRSIGFPSHPRNGTNRFRQSEERAEPISAATASGQQARSTESTSEYKRRRCHRRRLQCIWREMGLGQHIQPAIYRRELPLFGQTSDLQQKWETWFSSPELEVAAQCMQLAKVTKPTSH